MASNRTSIAVALLLVLGGCSSETDIGGCGDFNPRSAPMEVGESIEVDLNASETRWQELDVAGHYWESETPPPASMALPRDRFVSVGDGIATLVEAEWVIGTLESGVLVVDSADSGRLIFTGPLTCE